MMGMWFNLARDLSLLAIESQQVIALRCAALMVGGSAAQRETQKMFSEKIEAVGEAAMSWAAPGAPKRIIRGYRRRVRANRKRLLRPGK